MTIINKLTLGILFTCSLFSQNSDAMEKGDKTLAGSTALAGSVSKLALSEAASPKLPDEVIVKIAMYLDDPADLYSLSSINPNFRQGIKLVKELNLTLTEEDNRPKLNLSSLPHLTHLSVHCTNTEYAIYIKTFEKLQSLTEFCLKISGDLTPDLIKAINSLTHLTWLDLEKSLDITDPNSGKENPTDDIASDTDTESRESDQKLLIKSSLSYLALPSIKEHRYPNPELEGNSHACYNDGILEDINEFRKGENLKVIRMHSEPDESKEIKRFMLDHLAWQLEQFPNLQEVHFLDKPLISKVYEEQGQWVTLLYNNNPTLKIFGMVINGYPIEGESVKDIYNNFVKEDEAAFPAD